MAVELQTNRPSRILVTSGGWQASLACIQNLGRRRHEVYLVDHFEYAMAFSKYCAGFILSPTEYREGYIDFLVDLVKTGKYDVLIPNSDRCAYICSQYQDQLKEHIALALPDFKTFQIAASKMLTYKFALEHHIPIPKTYFPMDMDEVRKLADTDIFPCVVKVPISSASNGVFYANSKSELLDIYAAKDFKGQWPVIQEYVAGDFYGFTAVAQEGRILSYIMFRAHQEFSRGGTPPIVYSETDPSLYELASDLIAKLSWSGPVDLDYLKVEGKGYLLLEINPRFSGTLNLAYRLGIDLPWAYYCLAKKLDLTQIEQPAYRNGMAFRSVIPTEIVNLLKSKSYWGTFLKYFFHPNARTNIYWDDPKLLMRQIKEIRWDHINRRKIKI